MAEKGNKMIKVRYYPDEHKITMKGHAGAGPKGADIVCAAASFNIYTLASVMSIYDEFADKPMKFSDDDGKASLKVYPNEQTAGLIKHDFAYAMNGFTILQDTYPKNVLIRVIGAESGKSEEEKEEETEEKADETAGKES